MPPIVSHQSLTPAAGGGSQQPLTGTIPLSQLIEFIVQRTYHELTVLSELLPRKTDLERKIEITQFASRTRQLFIRLLALVKWTSSANKVDKCSRILSFLHQQQMLFVETADLLARMARETLVHARLPSFSLPCAVDVLTTGAYPRLPACIKEKILPPSPITADEKKQTLSRLSQIIEHRIVTVDLPRHMCQPRIDNGRVKFRVEHEFEVTMTLMGDGPNIPWRLLDIDILVEDPETGDGQSLVHSLQVNYIHQLVQSRLLDSEQPLDDVYACLHSFCQSLQLEVLHSQTHSLMRQRLGDYIRVEEYAVGKCLAVSYWRKDAQPFQQVFKLSIHINDADRSKPLQITHFPQILGSESTKVAQAVTSDYLSVEKILVHTIQVRSLAKLKELERELRLIITGPCEVKDVPIILYVPILTPCTEGEKLCITVDVMKGTFLVSLVHLETALSRDIEECLNTDRRDLRKLIYNLQCHLMLERCRNSLQHQMVACFNQLPLTNLSGHALESLGRHKLFARLPKQPDYYMVIEIYDATPDKKRKTLEYRYHLLQVRSEGVDPDNVDTASLDTYDSPRLFLRAGNLVHLDTFLCTHGQSGGLFDFESDGLKKRKLTSEVSEQPSKKARCSSWFVPQLTHIVALCEDRLPLITLCSELDRRNISHQGLQTDGEGIGLSVSLLQAPPCPESIDVNVAKSLSACLLSYTFRLQRRGMGRWTVELIFNKPPIRSTNLHEQRARQHVQLFRDKRSAELLEKTINSLLVDEWASIAHLYSLVFEFARVYNSVSNAELKRDIEVRSYNFKTLILAYGPSKCYTVSVTYSNQFRLVFGYTGHASIVNCHTLVASYLEKELNQTGSLSLLAKAFSKCCNRHVPVKKLAMAASDLKWHLKSAINIVKHIVVNVLMCERLCLCELMFILEVKTLSETWSLLSSVGRLPTSPIGYLKKHVITPTFSVIPQSPTHVRIIYRSMYCLDLQCRGSNLVSVRDGAYSMFESNKAVEGLNPISNLQSFLNMFVDETVLMSQARRRSTTEDDNPPSPVGIDTMDSLMSQQVGSNASMSSRRDMMIVPSPSSVLVPSPGNVALPVPSPSSFAPAPSPGSMGIHMPSPAGPAFISPQSMMEGGGSPYPSSSLIMPSPGPRNWPASPSLPGPSPSSRAMAPSPGYPSTGKDSDHKSSMLSLPSRTLPQRAWAASVPTLLSQDALSKLLTPIAVVTSQLCCPLERFLASVFLRRHLQRIMQTPDNLPNMLNSEPGVVLFKVESGLQCRICLNPTTMQSLRLKVMLLPVTDYSGVNSSQWDTEEFHLLEFFFETKVACVPFKPNCLVAFIQILKAPLRILKDFIQIMRLELVPDKSLRWQLNWCLTVPLSLNNDQLIGSSAVVIQSRKIVFMIQFTRVVQQPTSAGSQSSDPLTFVVPILYTTDMNVTQMMIDQKSPVSLSPTAVAVNNLLKRFHEINAKQTDCSIFPAIRELLTNLVV